MNMSQCDRTAEIRNRYRHGDVLLGRIERHRGVSESCRTAWRYFLRSRQHRSKCLRREAAREKQTNGNADEQCVSSHISSSFRRRYFRFYKLTAANFV